MTPSDFEALQNDVHAVFSALYLIDVDLLSVEERKQHQQVFFTKIKYGTPYHLINGSNYTLTKTPKLYSSNKYTIHKQQSRKQLLNTVLFLANTAMEMF